MSEVVGQILAFAIVAGVFILSLIAFGLAQKATENRVIQLQADSAASRVASVIVQTGLLVEEQGNSVRARLALDLPTDLEGQTYTVQLKVPGGGVRASIVVAIPSRGITASAPLFAVESPTGVALCPTTVHGGRIYARFSDSTPGTPAVPCMFLEAAP